MKILVTGGAGFIGSELAEKLILNQDNYVVIVDDLSTGSMDNLPKQPKNNWKFIRCDVNAYNDIAQIMQSHNFEYVFHYAAMVGVKRTQAHPIQVLADIRGFENIMTLSKNTGVKRVYFSSSSEVYGEPVELPQNEETTPLNSRIPYAIVKNVGEAFCKSYQKEYDLDFTIFRFFNTYGCKQSADFVMSRFISMALTNKDITIYGDGNQTRTFCFVGDNVDACINAFYDNQLINDVANIGSDFEISILDLANLIIKMTKSSSKIIHLPPLEEGDMTRRHPDISKMKQLLKRDLLPIEEGIRHILANPLFLK